MAVNTNPIIKSDIFLDIVHVILRLYFYTFRVTAMNETTWLQHLKHGGNVLLCCWHQQFLPIMAYLYRHRRWSPSLMISQSNDGDIGAGLCQRTGWRPVRGSSSRGGVKALKGIIRELRRSRLAAHIVDGPRGPAGIVKSGTIMLAQATRAIVVPVYLSADRAWFFKSWDRFMIPKPFARLQVQFGEPLYVSDARGKSDMEACRQRLESAMRPHLISPCASNHRKQTSNYV